MNSAGPVPTELDATNIRFGRTLGTRESGRWAAIARIGTQAFQFGTFVVLARILSTADFGLYALVAVVTGFGVLFANLGVAAAIVHSPTVDSRLFSAAFWMNTAGAAAMAITLVVLATPIASLFSEPRLRPLLLVASLVFAFSIGATHLAFLERELYFKLLAGIELAAAALGASVAIGAALAGVGATSLVLAPVVASATLSLGTIASVRFLPRDTDRAHVRRVWALGRGVVGFGAVNYWARNADNLLLGLTTSLSQLAFYSRAYMIMLAPVQQVSVVMSRVLFPALANLRTSEEEQSALFLRTLQLTGAVLFPLCLWLAATSQPFVSVLFGPDWKGMAPILAVLAISGPAQVLAATTGALYLAKGLGDALFIRGGIGAALIVVAIVAGLPWGAIGVATSYCICQYLILPYTLGPPLRLSGIPFGVFVRSVLPLAMLALFASGITFAVGQMLPGDSSLVKLAAQTVVMAAVYTTLFRVFFTGTWNDVMLVAGARK